MCFLKLKQLSIVIPSNSTWSDFSTLIDPTVRQYFGRPDFLKIINWNFPGFPLSRFKLNHLKRIFISCSRLYQIIEILSPQENIVLSSAKLHIDFSINKKTSLIKILKSRSPRIDPCGILVRETGRCRTSWFRIIINNTVNLQYVGDQSGLP